MTAAGQRDPHGVPRAMPLATREPNRRCVLASATTGFCEFLSRQGGDAGRILGHVGMTRKQLTNTRGPLDLVSYVELMELATDEARNDNFGLWYGQQFKPDALGLIGGIATASLTLGSALANVARFFPYHQHATHTAFSRQARHLRFEHRIIDGSIVERRQVAELTMGMFANIFRHCLGDTWAPLAVEFEHPRPPGWRDHRRAFAAPVHFGQRTNALIFCDENMHQPMPQGNLLRAGALSSDLVQLTGGVGAISLLDRVKGEIRSRLPDGIPFVGPVADSMGIPRWTLQRRLAEYGLNFSDVIDLVRRDLAAHHVRDSFVTCAEISDVLGYSELSAFSRAFRRWFGMAPQMYRTSLLVGAPRTRRLSS